MEFFPAHGRPTTALCTPNPYRDARDMLGERVTNLERENAGLRALAAFLVFLSMVLAAAAAWWFAVLWPMTR